jgi:hypothetical protein
MPKENIMKIEEKIDRYLNEKSSRKNDMKKLLKVIRSAKTDDQLEVAERMAKNYYKMYDETLLHSWDEQLGGKSAVTLNKLVSAIDHQGDVIKHLRKIQQELNK